MASKEDDNKLRFMCNENNDREVNIINVYKRLEFVLNNKCESFPNKIKSLIQVWIEVSQCQLTEHRRYVLHIMDWLKLHTLNIVLTGDWKKYKDTYEEKLLKVIKHCELMLLNSNNIFSTRCKRLAQVIKDPWGNPVLNRLLTDSDVVIGPQEIEFFSKETGYLISTRLRKLCESHCEDMALNLVTTFMNCQEVAEAQNFNLNTTRDQKRFILDVYIALLYKYKKTENIISKLKSLSLPEGLELLKRFGHKRVNISKIWKHSNRIAHLAAQVYIAAAVLKPPEESAAILEALLNTWFSLHESSDNLEPLITAIRRIIQPSNSAVHLYMFCEIFQKKFGSTMKTFSIELYIRALTTSMNDLERQKNEDDGANVAETTKQLASGFLCLADVLEEHVKVSRECVLTSFSLEPTESTLEKISRLAERCGYEKLDTGQSWKCKFHPPMRTTDEICMKCDYCGDYMSQPEFKTLINTSTALSEALTAEQLGLSSQLCDDLVVVLSSQRYQLFNWLLRWQDLHRLCVLYLNDPEGTKNLVTELKFVDIDYNMFLGMKREPEDELAGIERGYERYLEEELYHEERVSLNGEDSGSQESRQYSSGSDGMCEHFPLLPPPSTSSDPNVLKSLRLFRPNLKRTKQNPSGSDLPSKVFKSDFLSPLTTAQPTYSSTSAFPNTSKVDSFGYTYGLPHTGPLPPKFEDNSSRYDCPPPHPRTKEHADQRWQSLRPVGLHYTSKAPHMTDPVIHVQNVIPNYMENNYLLNRALEQNHPHNVVEPASSTNSIFYEQNDMKGAREKYNTLIPSCPQQTKVPEVQTLKHLQEFFQYMGIPWSQHVIPSTNNLEWKQKCDTVDPSVVKIKNQSNDNLVDKSKLPKETDNAGVQNFHLTSKNSDSPEKHSAVSSTVCGNIDSFNDNHYQAITCHDTISIRNSSHSEFEKPSTTITSGYSDSNKDSSTTITSGCYSDSNNDASTKDVVTTYSEPSDTSNSKSESRPIEYEAILPNNVNLTKNVKTPASSDVHCEGKCYLHSKTKIINTNDLHLLNKFNMGECSVVLHKLDLNIYLRQRLVSIVEKLKEQRKKLLKSDARRALQKSENRSKSKRNAKSNDDAGKKSDSKPWPLQDINPKANHRKDAKLTTALQTDVEMMNPRVVLKRLEFEKDKKRCANSLLANVPGLNDLQMIRPSSVDRIVQVVQVPGIRNTASVPIQSTQTSTQVTPHIQRIGQPRTEKPDQTIPDSISTTISTASSNAISGPVVTNNTSEPSTLINILSQQIVRPSNQGNCVGIRPRSSPVINILSQQIIKPASNIPASAKASSCGSAEVQVNNTPRVITGGDQILTQLINPVRTPAPTLKTLVSAPTSEQNRIVQFICKSSDGKFIPVTSFTSNKVVKVSMTQTVNSSAPNNTNADENVAKVNQTTPKAKAEVAENSDSLPKFQQAFGKPTYQNNVDSTENVTTTGDAVSSDTEKSVNTVKNQPKNSTTSLNVQPVQGGVIYTRQMPVGQTINIIPPGRGQVFRIAASNNEQLSLVKDTVIHGKMSALLAAALQGKPRTVDGETDTSNDENSQTSTRIALTTRPTLVQNARIVKPVLHIPTNVIRSAPQSNLSSTTLEQLREFDMVYKQVKERSSTNVPAESSSQSETNDPPPQISVTYLNQGQKINCTPVVVVSSYCNVQPAASPSLSVTSQGSSSPCVTPAPSLTLSKTITKNCKNKSIKTAITHAAKSSPIPKPQQKPQEDEHTTQRIFDILAEYAEQLRNSPDLNNKPAPRRRSNPPTNPNQNTKRKKGSSSRKTGQCSNSLTSDADMDDTHTIGSEDSSCGVVQISVQEEEQLTTISNSETSEASVSPKQLILTETTPNHSRSLIIADSNVGEALKMSNTAVLVPGNYIMPVSMVKGGQQIAVVSGGSKILATVPARSGPNMLLFQSFLNQTRKHGLPTVKYSTVQPISGLTRSVSSITTQPNVGSSNLTTFSLAQTIALQKTNHLDRTEVNNFDTELLLAIGRTSENKNVSQQSPKEILQTIRVGDGILNAESTVEKAFVYEEKTSNSTSIATSVISQSISLKDKLSTNQSSTAQTIMALNLNSSDSEKDTTIKVEGRVQSVLVATGISNGPMLAHNLPVYNKQVNSSNSISGSNKDEYLRNEGKRSNNDTKTSVYPYQSKIKKGQQSLQREIQNLALRKQAVLERELRFQKSLSEECEDLGVDEPSTSDLFPEADLLFDSNHSPSFDQSSQDLVNRTGNTQPIKEETKTIGLFCDDEPMRSDFLFEPIEYQTTTVELEDRSRDVTNGLNSTSNESRYSCEDNTLLQTCTSMSDVTIPSPISPDPYTDNSPPPPLNKCKYKYSNRRKTEKNKLVESWPMELSSSEDTTGSTELVKSCSRSPEIYSARRNTALNYGGVDEEGEMLGFTLVERLPLKDGEDCEGLHCEEAANCPSGRGARRSVKKLCSCCNGSTKVTRKRPASRPPTPFSNKKTVIAKKR